MTEAETVRNALAKMTPGEWQSGNRFGSCGVFDANERLVANTHGATTNTDVEAFVAQQNANAAGIVALKNHAPVLLAELDAARAEVARLRAENERLSKPNMFWDWEDSENGCDDLLVIMDAHELGFVARIQCAKSLPDMWAVGYITESGGFNAKAFATKDEAEAFAARAALEPRP